jgi:hypothetical protein
MSNAGDHDSLVSLPPGDEDYMDLEDQHVPPHVPQPQFQQQWQQPQFQQQQFPPWWMQPPYVPPQPQAPTPQPHKTNLEKFWTHNPRVWFTQAESAFNTCHVRTEHMKFDLVVAKLAEGTLDSVQSIVEAPELLARPYQALKLRLLEVYQPDTWESVSRVLHFRELGDQKPSQLMDQMLASLPRGEVPGLLFKGIFLDRMPADVRAHVQGAAEDQECRQLAAACDVVWLARVKKSGKVAVVASEAVEEMTEHVAALSVQAAKRGGAANQSKSRGRGKGRGGGRGRGDGRSRGKLPGFTCWRHVQYGEQAWQCEDPGLCSFQPAEN